MRPATLLPCRQRLGALAVLVAAASLSLAFDLDVAGFLVVCAGFGLAGYWLADAILPSRAALDRLLATVTLSVACLSVVAEVLSLLTLLGNTVAWLVATTACGVASGMLTKPRSRWCARASQRLAPTRPNSVILSILSWGGMPAAHPDRLPLAGRLLTALILLAVALHLAAAFVLTWFAGINVGDSLTHYLPRSVRFLQNGTFGIDQSYYDFMQYLHQLVVAVQLLFLKSDVLVNVTSFVAVSLTSLGIYALARSLRWPTPYPLFAALVPWSMPIVLLHASTSNFDTFTAQWLVFALYFLRRGFAGTSRGWLVLAAVATGLMFAAKPTAWFAVPGLGLLWLATAARPLVRWRRSRRSTCTTVVQSRLRAALPTLVLCAGLAALVGTPFLLRNVISRGYLVAPPRWQEFQLGGSATGLDHHLRLLEFNTFAIGLELLTPPFLLPARVADGLDGWFAARAQALGYRLPDPSITVHADWSGLIRHVSHRYDSNHASFGAAFVLVTLPSLLALPFARRRLGPLWWYALGLAVVGVSYFLVLNTMSIYSFNNIRYLIEMVAALAALAPALFVLLPRPVGGALALAVSLVLLFELHDVFVHDKQLPPDLVMRVPRTEQYYVFNGNFPTPARAAALFDQKYPPEELPDVYIDDPGTPTFPDYTFQGPSQLRRTHYLATPTSPSAVIGPFLTRDGGLVQRLVGTPGASGSQSLLVDQLAADVWLLLPNDRPRVLFWSTRTPTGELVLRFQASVPPGRYQEPQYSFTLRAVRGDERLLPFQASPVLEIPYDQAGRGTIQVDVRDGAGGRQTDRLRVERARFMGI
jgi:4-amino-4-deoxy-L-arabinose transferase-like glycosyltransferase